MTKILILLLLFIQCLQLSLSGQPKSSVSKLEMLLRKVANGTHSSTDLTVIYDDMHPLHGGLTISVSGKGVYKRLQRAGGRDKPKVTRRTLTARQVRELAVLLLAVRAWQQETPERMAVPDESRGRLTIRLGRTEVEVWEWYNDMEKNKRLIRVQDRLVKLGG